MYSSLVCFFKYILFFLFYLMCVSFSRNSNINDKMDKEIKEQKIKPITHPELESMWLSSGKKKNLIKQ